MIQLWEDDRAFVVSAELTLIATILAVGVVVGLVSVRDSVLQELGDVASAIGILNQSYSYSGVEGCWAWTAGSCFWDRRDFCDCPEGPGVPPIESCVNVHFVPAGPEGVVGPGGVVGPKAIVDPAYPRG